MRRLISLSLWAAIALPGLAQAQPDHRHGPTATVVVGGHWPTEAPPAPREEHGDVHPGEVWVKGRWDWKNGKWEWMAGHKEHEQAGKHWREARWENKNGHFELAEGGWEAGGGAPTATVVVGGQYPTEAPPPLREEKFEARHGEVFVKGRWDWKGGKWEWMPGRWEHEQAGKHWREARWENKNGHFELEEGGWEAGAPTATVMPTPTPSMDGGEHHHHEWKLDRPTVSSYWPTKGKVGQKVVIRGANFPLDATVTWGGTEIKGAKVSATEIEFHVPEGAASGEIALHPMHGRTTAVGSFEVAASYDPIAEQKRIDDERHKAAEAAWAAQQAKFAHDKAARQAEVEKRWGDMDASREQRREQRLAEIKAKWDAAFLADADTQAELTLHAQRTAELTRMHDLAEINGDAKLGTRVAAATDRETTRHDARMTALQASFKAGVK